LLLPSTDSNDRPSVRPRGMARTSFACCLR
jgi:hypothetical protein